MRLQVAIIRHTLPPVNVVFNTDSAPEPVVTVSDFLCELNAVVPIESSDGEWGREEYAVEISARIAQEKVYECLHFQLVKDVFREDEEVTVRCLTTEEIRQRRQGGRIQISSDGRRLLDGVAWGRRFRPFAHRPDVIIPPRKRRKLIVDEDNGLINDEERAMLQLEYPSFRSQIGTMLDNGLGVEEDDDDDEDYVEGEGEEDDDDEETDEGSELDGMDGDLQMTEVGNHEIQQYADNLGRAVTTHAAFDDADTDDDDDFGGSDESWSDNISDLLPLDEIGMQMMLAERAKMFEEATRPVELYPSPTGEQNGEGSRRVSFADSASPKKMTAPKSAGKLGSYTVEAIHDNNDEEATSEEDSDYTSDSGEGSETSDDSDETSSSGESDSESDEDTESTSSSGSDSSSDESDDKSTDVRPNKSDSLMNGSASDSASFKKPAADNPPGSGSLRTKKNNDRMKRRKRLDHLKSLGKLDENADFEALHAYEASQKIKQPSDNQVDDHETHSNAEKDALEAKRTEILARINHEPNEAADDLAEADAQLAISHQSIVSLGQQTPVLDESATKNSQHSNDSSAQTPSKRSRLDLASTRRMLFSSLGLRNPKTKAAEDEMRNKSIESARKADKRSSRPQAEELASMIDNDTSWRNKLIISAVECVQEGRVLKPPPFPFKQHWEKADSERGQQRKVQRSDVTDDHLNNDDTVMSTEFDDAKDSYDQEAAHPSAHDASTQHNSSSRDEDLIYPDDIGSLKDLSTQSIVPGMVIAYKELHMNSRFEPEESTYRVARVTNVTTDHIDVQLSKQDRRDALSSIRLDSNGDRFYHGLELPEDDYDFDDGSRQLTHESMINPKLVQAADLQVPVSIVSSQSIFATSQHESAIIPESALLHEDDASTSNHDNARVSSLRSLDEDELLRPIKLSSSKDDSSANTKTGTDIAPPSGQVVMESVMPTGMSNETSQRTSNVDTYDRSMSSGRPDDLSLHDFSAPCSSSGEGQSPSNLQPDLPSASPLGDNFTSFHDEGDSQFEDSASLKSIPIGSNSRLTPNHVKEISPPLLRRISGEDDKQAVSSQVPSSGDFMDAHSQQGSEKQIASADHGKKLSMDDNPSVIPSTPISHDDGHNVDHDNDQKTASQTRSSQRIARTKIDISSPAAKMMASALAGLGSRKSLKARKKAKA